MRMRDVGVLSLAVVLSGCGGGGGGGGGPTGPDRGTLNGLVTGPGGPIPDAQVTLTGGGSVETNDDGRFSFSNVEAGSKTVTITPPSGWALAGGETAQKQASVTAGGTASVNWSLRLTDTNPRTVDVGLSATSFVSSDVTVPVGSTIHWENQTAVSHTISPNNPAQAGTWAEVNISGVGTDFNHTFGTAGTFDYVCKLHAGMTGVVRVH